MTAKLVDIISSSVEKALKRGADSADAVIFNSSDLNVRKRLGKTETIERAESASIGLRAFVKSKDGLKQAIVSTNDTSEESLNAMIEQVVNMAKVATPDEYLALADDSLFEKNVEAAAKNLELFDATEVSPETLLEWAGRAEDTALAVEGVTNSEGADASFSSGEVALVTSNGFAGTYKTSNFAVSASVIAGSGTAMETDYDYHISRHAGDLRSPELIGKIAGERAVKRLKPRKIKSCQVPLVFESRTARSLISSLASAINGSSVAKGTSFLCEKMGGEIFAKGINIVDDPLLVRGIASEPFDGEGVSGSKLNVIEDGILKSWLLDIRSANKLGLTTTGHGSRGTSSPPSPCSSNFYLENGEISPEKIIRDIKSGLFVTEAFGMGVNGVTGDYSQGASGFWIENGEIAYPVSEITIAGNLLDMFKNLIPANDLEFLYGTNSPTVRIDGMTIAGV